MAVKARENVRMREFSPMIMVGIGVFVIAYILLYDRFVGSIEDYALKTGIGIAALAIMILLFIFVLRYISTSFDMLLSHAKLTVDRKILFWNKQVADIPTKDFLGVVKEENYKNTAGKPQNLTVGAIEGMAKYIITYRVSGGKKSVKIQCSPKFFKEVKQLVESNQKAVSGSKKKK